VGKRLIGRYRKVAIHTWSDSKFLQLSNRGKLAWLFFLTHPQTLPLGAIRMHLSSAAEELKMPKKALIGAIKPAVKQKMLFVNDKKPVIWLPNYLRYNPPESINAAKALFTQFQSLPDCTIKWVVLAHVLAFGEALPQAFREALKQAFGEALPKDFRDLVTDEELVAAGFTDDIMDDLFNYNHNADYIYRKIPCSIWNEDWFAELPSRGKLLWFYCYLHPNMTPFGLLPINLKEVAKSAEIALQGFPKALKQGFGEGMNALFQIFSYPFFRDFVIWNSPQSANVILSRHWAQAFRMIPNEKLQFEIIKHLREELGKMSSSFLKALEQTKWVQGFGEGKRKALGKASARLGGTRTLNRTKRVMLSSDLSDNCVTQLHIDNILTNNYKRENPNMETEEKSRQNSRDNDVNVDDTMEYGYGETVRGE